MFTIGFGFATIGFGIAALYHRDNKEYIFSARPFVADGTMGIRFSTDSLSLEDGAKPYTSSDGSEWLTYKAEHNDMFHKINKVGESVVVEEFTKYSHSTPLYTSKIAQSHLSTLLPKIHEKLSLFYSSHKIERFDNAATPYSIDLLGVVTVNSSPKIGIMTKYSGIPNNCRNTITVVGYSNGSKFMPNHKTIIAVDQSIDDLRKQSKDDYKLWTFFTKASAVATAFSFVIETLIWNLSSRR